VGFSEGTLKNDVGLDYIEHGGWFLMVYCVVKKGLEYDYTGNTMGCFVKEDNAWLIGCILGNFCIVLHEYY
jgi:hypothetical protein